VILYIGFTSDSNLSKNDFCTLRSSNTDTNRLTCFIRQGFATHKKRAYTGLKSRKKIKNTVQIPCQGGFVTTLVRQSSRE